MCGRRHKWQSISVVRERSVPIGSSFWPGSRPGAISIRCPTIDPLERRGLRNEVSSIRFFQGARECRLELQRWPMPGKQIRFLIKHVDVGTGTASQNYLEVTTNEFVQCVVFVLRQKSGRPVSRVMPVCWCPFCHGHGGLQGNAATPRSDLGFYSRAGAFALATCRELHYRKLADD